MHIDSRDVFSEEIESTIYHLCFMDLQVLDSGVPSETYSHVRSSTFSELIEPLQSIRK